MAEALKAFEDGLQLRPEHPELLAEAGWALSELGESGRAEERLRAAWSTAAPPAGVLLALVRLYLGPLQRSGAAEELLEGPPAPTAAPAPERVRAELELALSRGQLDDGLRLASTLRTLCPDDPQVALEAARAANEAAGAAHTEGDSERAVFLLRRALAAAPHWAGLHTNLGRVLAAIGRPLAAEREFEQALALDASDALAELGLAQLLRGQRALAAAAIHFRRALELDPELPDARPELAEVLDELGRPAEAAQELAAELARDPRCPLCHHNLGVLLARLGDPRGAQQHFGEALRLDPDDHRPHYNLAALHALAGEAPEALVHLTEALRLEPSECRAWLQADAGTFGRLLEDEPLRSLLSQQPRATDEE